MKDIITLAWHANHSRFGLAIKYVCDFYFTFKPPIFGQCIPVLISLPIPGDADIVLVVACCRDISSPTRGMKEDLLSIGSGGRHGWPKLFDPFCEG